MGWSSATLILVCECTLFVTIGTWATDHSIFLWRMVLMNGLVHQTATLALITTSRYQTSLSTTTLRCSAGNITHKHTARLKIYIQISFPMTQWNSLAVCSSGWVECLSPPRPSSFFVPAVLVYSIFRPFVFPKTAICVFRVIGTGSRACFSLSHGFNQHCIPGPWTEAHTHVGTYTGRHTHALKRRQVALAVCEDTWRKWSVRKRCLSLLLCLLRHASAAPHNSSLCSASLTLPKYGFHQNFLQTPSTGGKFTSFLLIT